MITTEEKLMFIESVICDYFNVTPEQLRIKIRREEYRRPRQWFFWLARYRFGDGIHLTTTGKFMGGYNHATVIHSRKVINNDISTSSEDKKISEDLKELTNISLYVAAKEKEETLLNMEGQIYNWLQQAKKHLQEVKDHIEDDHSMEGWRRYKVTKEMDSFEDHLNKIQKFKDYQEQYRKMTTNRLLQNKNKRL